MGKYNNHPSILKIKEHINSDERFHFRPIDETIINEKIRALNKRKPTTYNNIPTKY